MNNLATQLQKKLKGLSLSPHDSYIDLIPQYLNALPEHIEFNDNTWDVLEWLTRKGRRKSLNLNFKTTNDELELAIKFWILSLRATKQLSGLSAKAYLGIIPALNSILGSRKLLTLSNADFIEVEKWISLKYNKSTPARYCGYLEQFGYWLNITFGLRISYTKSLTSTYLHGRKATDKSKDEKLFPTPVLIDLLSARTREDLIDKDKFFLNALTLLIPAGFRGNELMTIPRNCMPDTGAEPCILHYPSKKPQLGSKPIPQSMIESVTSAYKYLVEKTESGREAAILLRQKIESGVAPLDWNRISENDQAFRYFVKIFCHNWTAEPLHHVWNNKLAWFEREKRYINIIKLLEEHKSQVKTGETLGVNRNTISNLLKQQKSALKKELYNTTKSGGKNKRTSWDTDSRVISFLQLEKKMNFRITQNKRDIVRDIIDDARDNYQLKGKLYPIPERNENLEREYLWKIRPVIESKDGQSILEPEDALFIIQKYELVESRGTKNEQYHILTLNDFSRWLCGEKRSHGTKNLEDSAFSRLEIIDPRTGEIAKFTSHDVRHWLTTYYAEGGMSEESIALLFNRDKSQNSTYDQTSSKTRLNNLRSAIREGKALGHASNTFSQIAKYSREEAEQYLLAYTLSINIMPHGACTLNWGMAACPNQHSCFAGDCEANEEGVCQYLSVDINDQNQMDEIKRIKTETIATLDFMPENSPQYEHLQRVEKNISKLLEMNDA